MSINTLRKRIGYMGGDAIGRINKQKRRSLHSALKNDYNSRQIILPDGRRVRCLMNLNNLKPDYDKKWISVDHDANLKPGDVYQVVTDNSHWMIYLPDLAETAYLRAEIIRCRYSITINKRTYWIYFQGPVETKIRWEKQKSISFNQLNLTGTIYIENNEETRACFSRFKKFKLEGHTWQVNVVDSISVPGILELEIREYYDDKIADLPEIREDNPIIKDPTADNDEEVIRNVIVGSTEVKPGKVVGYHIPDDFYKPGIEWKIHCSNKGAARIKEIHESGKICAVEVDECGNGVFWISYGCESLPVHIDTIKPFIEGPMEVYPYGKYEYEMKNIPGEFFIESPLAKIIAHKDNKCKVEILSGRSGRFELKYRTFDDDELYTLPIKIRSL